MMAESGGDPRAVSDVGAEGAYQIMPATAADPGFGVRPMEGSRFDPEASREFAGDYLQAMLDRYEGDMEAALVAYNAGPSNADKFVAAGKDYEVLPQAMQTQPYVSRVLGGIAGEDNSRDIRLAGGRTISTNAPESYTERRRREQKERSERLLAEQYPPRESEPTELYEPTLQDAIVVKQAQEYLTSPRVRELQETIQSGGPDYRVEAARQELADVQRELTRAPAETPATTRTAPLTEAEAFRQTPLGNVMEVQNMMEDMYGPTPKQQPAPKKGIAGLLDRIGGTQGLLNVAETLGRGAGASKGFEAAKIVEESAKARQIAQARQDQLDKLREQLEVEREKIGATKAVAESKALAALSKEQREVVGEFLTLPATQARITELQEELGAESAYDPRVLAALQPDITAYLNIRGVAGSVGGMPGLPEGVTVKRVN
jgi:hypothetical protein